MISIGILVYYTKYEEALRLRTSVGKIRWWWSDGHGLWLLCDSLDGDDSDDDGDESGEHSQGDDRKQTSDKAVEEAIALGSPEPVSYYVVRIHIGYDYYTCNAVAAVAAVVAMRAEQHTTITNSSGGQDWERIMMKGKPRNQAKMKTPKPS